MTPTSSLCLPAPDPAPRANRCYLPVEASLLIPSIVLNFLPEFRSAL